MKTIRTQEELTAAIKGPRGRYKLEELMEFSGDSCLVPGVYEMGEGGSSLIEESAESVRDYPKA